MSTDRIEKQRVLRAPRSRVWRAIADAEQFGHPYAGVPDHDYSGEPRTLVTFTLADHPEGTLLTIVESGFDALPPARRETAWRMNDGGWTEQVRRIAAHVGA